MANCSLYQPAPSGDWWNSNIWCFLVPFEEWNKWSRGTTRNMHIHNSISSVKAASHRLPDQSLKWPPYYLNSEAQVKSFNFLKNLFIWFALCMNFGCVYCLKTDFLRQIIFPNVLLRLKAQSKTACRIVRALQLAPSGASRVDAYFFSTTEKVCFLFCTLLQLNISKHFWELIEKGKHVEQHSLLKKMFASTFVTNRLLVGLCRHSG